MEQLVYAVNEPVGVEEFIRVLNRSGLGERRPVQDRDCIRGMLENSNLVVTARIGGTLIGIARSVTDFHYACYLSDLCVDRDYQARGIGITLQKKTRETLGPRAKLILLAAPKAAGYYPRIGYTNHPGCWIITPEDPLG
ncbi:GNAT family N-acetyltransferase [Spirochaeta lutea]|uniref:GCN5 family acetyltransferase n=1 Tax=Spirochaeta lutea TaxID=1480694 RepID=A0A098R014_9SPIO|nr:GNAT family N-acetyltransferase [Spirochaeta lutea]KGE72072.1 GCN5 family acetyltransferase [Spirochaeta lutea]